MRYGFSLLGSGTTPYVEHCLPNIPHSSSGIVYRDGEQVIIINPEDFSVHLGGETTQVTLSPSTVTRIDIGLTKRRSMAITNTSTGITVYIGFRSNITTTGSNGGFPLLPQQSITIDCKNIIRIYAIASVAATLGILEVA